MSRIGYLLNRPALEIRQKVEGALAPLHIIPPHMGILSTLLYSGPQTQRSLGTMLKVDPTTMVWLIDGLEKKGLVRRGEHPKDRRAHLVELSAEGKALYRRAGDLISRVEDEFLAPLSKTEQHQLKQLLTKLFQSVPMQAIPPKFFHGKND
jgi:DNA-binding MarR family transcriptional regulator